ncbi:CapA family protein [Proteiniborus sp.]|uniref:CapA family protein n=1 Tax=Proteiniborus sp. TaxID=2079015 RepID=UPI003327B108
MNKKRLTLGIIILLFFASLLSAGYFSDKFVNPIENNLYAEEIGNKEVEKIPEIQEEIPPNIEATIAAAGDIMFHSPQIKGAYIPETKEYDFSFSFEHIQKYIESADLAIGNFETVTAGDEYGYKGYPTFNSPESAVTALKNAGFDILSTANNHSIDKGKKGIINTIDNILEHGLKNVGTYKEPTDEMLIQDINGIKAAILSYTYGCNGLECLLTQEELSYMVNIINEDRIKSDIEKADANQVDTTIVIMHWGNEYQREPSEYQIELANKMIKWGADIILGSHPHVIQRSEIVEHNGENKFIIYSMGNFISNQRRETLNVKNKKYTEDGVIVNITLEKDFSLGKTVVKDVDYIPTWVYKYSESGVQKHVILPTSEYIEQEKDGLSKEVLSKIEESYNNTIQLMDQR